ncbi:ATP synthase subunit b [Marinomonas spartinae]|uniref:ATP synthase subunit b n=1 Tax=Marinomonas spartinae TaxID=1792290 RepID=A0A1A8T2B6_9GAMM|nr:F0F1 ATP synthase subunit B [Marinomonas spartinae]SBS25068.1 ATP synthase subunit b [Marinomonas spartinae]SBS25081.1 ATP synthase subunit b [Marinomonas spartinae]
MNINATIIGQAIAFVIFIAFCMKYVWPPIMQALEERKKKIADSFEAANQAARELELAEEKAAQTLRESKEHAAEIIEQANKRANQLIDESKEQAIADGKRLREAAQAEIEQDVVRAKEALRAQVSALAFAGAEKILGTTIDEKAHSEIVEQLAKEL